MGLLRRAEPAGYEDFVASRVRVPAGLGKELLDLIVASDRAVTERATKD
jgi:hypothetical protein